VWRASPLTARLCLCKQHRHPHTLRLLHAAWLLRRRPVRIAWSLPNNHRSSTPHHLHTFLSTDRTHSDTPLTHQLKLQDLHTPTRVLRCICKPQDRRLHNVLLINQVNMLLPRRRDHPHTSSHHSILPVPWDRPVSHMDISRIHPVTPRPRLHQLQLLAQYISPLYPTLHLPRHQQLGK
jgi:hypothetical protein